MTGDIVIRAMEETDAPGVAAMVRRLAAHISSPDLTRTTAETLVLHGFRDDPAFETLVAERAQELIGYCLMTRTYSTWRAAAGVFVVDLYVDNAIRRQGLGKRLLAAAADWGAVRGCRFLKLDVDPDNDTARVFYTGLGFRDDHDHAMVIEYDNLNALKAE